MEMRRAFLPIVFVFLSFSALTGCSGSKFTGSLPGRDGDGTGPKPSPGQAQVTSLSPSTIVAGGPTFTLTVNGLNFAPTTAVLWNDTTSLTTTYVSSTVLKAQVPASLIAKPETVDIAPSPLGTFNFVTNFTITTQPLTGNNSFSVSMFPVQANDMVWDEVNQQLYLSVASGNGTNANTITALNPQNRALGSSISLGSEPGRLAISQDSTYLYAGSSGANSVRRYTLPALQSDLDIPLGTDPHGPYYAIDLAVDPHNSHSVAVARGVRGFSPNELGGILIYDDATARSQSVPGTGPGPGPIDTLLWNADGKSLYGLDTETSANGFYTMSVSSAGVHLETQSTIGSSGNALHSDSTTGYLYSDSGKVINPATGAVIGSFPFNTIQGGFSSNPIMIPDGRLNIAYFLGQTVEGGSAGNYALEAFDLTHFTFLGAVPITNVKGIPFRMVRWGSNGLAFLTGVNFGVGGAGDGVYVVSGDFVTSPAP